MPTFVDDFLNRITMYRLVLYYLIVLVALAAVLGYVGMLPYPPADLAFSVAVILAASWLTNIVFAKTFAAPTGVESVYITALILALIISPVSYTNYAGIGFLIFASAWASASKYIFAIGKKHVFNPAAFGVALSALAISQGATWWVAGNLPLLPVLFIGGLLIVRKLRRFDLVLTFFAVALVTIVLTSSTQAYFTILAQSLLHSSIFFLGFVMLTEPLTMPPDRLRRVLYGAIVGFLFAPNIHIGTFYFTPELALLVGNAFSYLVSPKGRFVLTLLEKKQLANGVWEFVFAPDRGFLFRAGQYVEWTLPHRGSDSRGNRRYFTIASSPTEPTVRLGVKFYEPMSTFKRALMALKPGDGLSVAQLSGDFTLPRNTAHKLAFIAGGIGVTPFRSMVQHMLDTKSAHNAVMLYSNKTAGEVAYKDVFDRAQQELGMKVVYAVTDEHVQMPGFYSGSIDPALIAREVPDYRERTFYISGPRGMIVGFTDALRAMGVPRRKIKTDYFPGFA